MDYAAMNGRLICLEWLHANGKECTTIAMDYAAENDHLICLEWLQARKMHDVIP
jgi:Ankyrin repeats (many copies)